MGAPGGPAARRRSWRRTALPVLAGLVCARAAAAGQALPASPSPGPTPAFGTAAARVLLDIVVRDRKGRPVPDVGAAEVRVLEDGVEQTIEGFRWVGSPPAPAAAAAAVVADARRPPNLVSLVFDQLGPDARRLAARAAQTFLDRGLGPNTWVGVFQIDQRLALVQPFTSDLARLKEAVALATTGTYKGLVDERAALAEAQKALEEAAASTLATPGSGPPANTGGFAARAQAQALANMLRLSSTLQRQQVATTSLYPLLALMRGHQTLAGRKTLVYLSEGLQVPPNLEAVFRSTISEANRANVSVYAIDARGLNVDRSLGAAADALEQARRVSQRAMESQGAGGISKDEIHLADTAESALRLNVEQTLADLSESTGGFLVANTNDFRQGADRLAADLSGHYELTYTPPNVAFDGRFRTIEVKVARKGVVVQARSGYFALPHGDSAALLAYELPLLAALSRNLSPRDLDIHAATLRFEDGPAGREHRLIVETRTGGLAMIEDRARKSYRVHFSLLALVKDARGEIVERFSEDYPLQGPIEKADLLKLGHVVFKRRMALPTGTYVLEVAAQDRETGAVGVVRSPFDVPPPGPGPRTSSVVVIRRVDPVGAPTPDGDDPLVIGSARVVPNLDLPISVAANQKLSLFFIVYPEGGAPPALSLEFWRDGKAVARGRPELPPPDSDGRIRYVGTFPIQTFAPGTYEVRVALSGAEGRGERAGFTLVP